MTHILRVNPNELILKVANQLKSESLVEPLEWSKFVKTGHHKQRVPDNEDWWYVRAAAIMRKVASRGPIGTEKLRTAFGGKKNRGHKPEKFFKASGSILRKILQQLEKSELVKQTEIGVHKGRVLTPKGVSFLDKIAVQIAKEERKNGQE